MGQVKFMSDNSKIEWTDATWNPVRGCTRISPGCLHCYAETFAERFRGVSGHPFEFGFDLRLVPEKLGDPILWSKPRKIFVNSMSDLFHEGVPDEYIEKVCRVMLAADWHTYQILTKRADRMAELLRGKLRDASKAPHIWWGVSVENRKHGLPRIARLRSAKPAVAFLSVEPLLEDLGKVNLGKIDWVIVGGESGAGARPMLPQWVRSVRAQCKRLRSFSNNGVACVRPVPDGYLMEELMTNSPLLFQTPFRRPQVAQVCWWGWLLRKSTT